MRADEYKRSLKSPAAEEVLDLVFFRPLGYAAAEALSRTRITPNQVTAFSLVTGLCSAFSFGLGTNMALMAGALLYALANVLDCADGQLARLQQRGTLLGRVWDGVADYLSSIAVFIGIGIGVADAGWGLVAMAGISSGFHAMVFDHHQSAFMALAAGNKNFLHREIDRFEREMRRMNEERCDGVKVLLMRIYIVYLRLQIRFGKSPDPQRLDKSMIRFWSFLGPTTNRTLLIICALLGRMDLYLWIVAAAGNVWLAICFLMERM